MPETEATCTCGAVERLKPGTSADVVEWVAKAGSHHQDGCPLEIADAFSARYFPPRCGPYGGEDIPLEYSDRVQALMVVGQMGRDKDGYRVMSQVSPALAYACIKVLEAPNVYQGLDELREASDRWWRERHPNS